MALVFIAIDPDTTGDHCPAVFAEEETGDLLFQGWTVTDPPDPGGGSTAQPDRGQRVGGPAPGADEGNDPGGA